MISTQISLKAIIKNFAKYQQQQQLLQAQLTKKTHLFNGASRFGFSSTQASGISEEERAAIQWQIKLLNSTKNKEKQFEKEVLPKIKALDQNLVGDILNCMKEHSFNKLSLINLLKNSLFSEYNMNDLEIKFIQQLFKESANPSKMNDYVEIIDFLSQEHGEQIAKILNDLDISAFQKEFNRILIDNKEDVELTQIVEWIKTFQAKDHSVEMNGIINEKTFDDLYDLSAKEWIEILTLYRLSGNVDFELLKEMDKILSKESELLYADDNLFCKYIQLCAIKDFKPLQNEEYQKHLKEIIFINKRIMAPLYIESLQYINREYVADIFTTLMQMVDNETLQNSIHSRDILRQFGVIPDPHVQLRQLISDKKNDKIAAFIKQRQEKIHTGHPLQIEELFLITKHIYDNQMMQRNSDARNLNLPHIITQDEQNIIIEMIPIVNRFMKEKGYKKANSLKQFLEVSSISFFMGFLKQQQECFDSISPQYLKSFQRLYMFPLIIQFGKQNEQLLINLIPTYADYISNKYINRNQLTFSEATFFMTQLHQVKNIYEVQNAKYHHKEFIYGIKTVSRLIINTFQMRIYANYKDIKSNKKMYENFFMEQKDTRWQTEKEKIEISTDLNSKEIDELLNVFYLVNDMNVGSKEFYDSMEVLVLQYYDTFSLKQKALSAYILSTIDAQNEKVEKKIEETIHSTKDFTLEEAVQLLSYLTARYSLNEDLWKKLISVIEREDKAGTIISTLKNEYKLSLYLTRECLLLEQNHIPFPLSQNTEQHISSAFNENQRKLALRETKFTEAIKYFLDRMGYYYDSNQKASIFTYQFSKLDENNLLVIQDKWCFIGDTKAQRSYNSIMIRMLTKKKYKLKIFNVYDWAGFEKRSEKISYLKSKVKGMSYDGEKQKKKTYFNF